jgi:hypothetical protein
MKRITTRNLLLLAFLTGIVCSFSQPTWTVNPVQSPFRSGGLMLLLPDGSVLCKSSDGGTDGFGNMWFKLTPNAGGSYMNGTWSAVAPMVDTRLYFSSQILKNGKLYLCGGEYGTGKGTAELYDPVANTWVNLPAGQGHYFGDANSEILDDGKILQAELSGNMKQTYLYDPLTNTYSLAPACIGQHAEASWMKLPDNSVLFVDLLSTASERYIPALNQWVADATVPVNLYDPFIFETGPAMLLPNGKALFFGSTGNTAIYTPSGNSSPGSWITGPPLPAGRGGPDTQSAMEADGKIILTASNAVTATATGFDPPTYFYEFDYTTNTYTQVQAPGGGTTVNDSAFNFNMLNLPDGTIMLSQVNNTNFYFHKPAGAAMAAGVPTINSITQSGCANSFTATGLLFNGISEGAYFGDDWQMNTNFPIIRLQSGSNVYYARTYNWNHTGVRTGNLADTTQFSLPANIPAGTYSLYVVVNGIPSAPYTFTFNAFPTLTSPLIMPTICSGTTFTYNAITNSSNTTVQWTRPAVSGISNPAITTPQSSNPSETLVNTSTAPKTVIYSYTLSNGGCTTYYPVSCVVSSGPSTTVTGNSLICPGQLTTLTVTGANSFTWSTGANTTTLSVSPTVTTIYTVSAKDLFGCVSANQRTVTVKPYPAFTVSGSTIICLGDSTVLTVSGNATIFHWNTGPTTPSISVKPTTNTGYTVTCNLSGGCPKADSVKVIVGVCSGIKQFSGNEEYTIYPNPFSQFVTIELQNAGQQNVKANVTDIFGRSIRQEEMHFDRNNSINKIDLKELESGIYFLLIQGESGRSCFKMVKE